MLRYLKYDTNNSMLLPIHCIPYSTHHPIMGHLYSPGKGVYGLFTASKVHTFGCCINSSSFPTGERNFLAKPDSPKPYTANCP